MLNFVEKRAKSGNDEYLVIILHGFGDSGENIISVSEYFSDISENICFVAPNGPQKTPFFGYQWFPLNFNDMSPSGIFREIRNNYEIVRNFVVEQVSERKIDYRKVFLMGFSQGAMMALFAGLRLGQKIAGILSFSGLYAENPDGDLESELAMLTRQEILMIHSSGDEIVPYECLSAGKKYLEKLGIFIKTHSCRNRVGHMRIDDDCVAVAKEFMKNNEKLIMKN